MSTIATLMLLGIVAFTIYQVFAGYKKGRTGDDGKMICPACGSQGWPVNKVKGSIGIEIILWLCFIVPGLIYSIWRMASKYDACPVCQQAGMIPLSSPKGTLLATQFAPTEKSVTRAS